MLKGKAMSEDYILFKVEEGIGTVILNRPGKRNTFDWRSIVALKT